MAGPWQTPKIATPPGAPIVISDAVGTLPARAQDQPDKVFKVFQFPANMIPRIDGDASDWAMVPESYTIGIDQLHNEHPPAKPDPKKVLDVKVKVGWVKGLNRLYFLYEADDDYWDFSEPGLHNDTLELIVDGDLSGVEAIAARASCD